MAEFKSLPLQATPIAGSTMLNYRDDSGKNILIPTANADGTMSSPEEAVAAYKANPDNAVDSSTKRYNENLDDIPTTTFDEQVAKRRAEITAVAAVKSNELALQKEAAKQPVTQGDFESVAKLAASTPDYEEFMSTKTALPPEQMNQIWAQTRVGEANALENKNKNSLFTDAEINDSALKATANSALGLVGRVGDIAGSLLNAGSEVAQTIRRAGISDEDFNNVKSVHAKEAAYWDAFNAARTETDPGKKEILAERIKANSFENYTDAEKSIFEPKTEPVMFMGTEIGTHQVDSPADRIRQLKLGDNMEKSISNYAGVVTNAVNKSTLESLTQSLTTDFNNESSKFGTGIGNDIDAVVNLVADASTSIINNPEAVAQLVTQTLPDIVTASRALPAALAGNFSEKQAEARTAYVSTYGKDPEGEDLTKLNAGAIAASLLDTFGDKFVAGKGVDLTKLASSIGLSSGSSIVNTAAKVATKLTQGTLTGAAGEAIAEGGGNYLTQLAGKQDVSKISGAEVFTEATLGAAAGGVIHTITHALGDASEAVSTVAEKMQVRNEARAQGDIKSMVSDVRTMDIPGATAVMKDITANPQTTPEQKATAIKDLESAFDHRALIEVFIGNTEIKQADEGFDEKRQASIEKGKKIIADMDRAAEVLKVAKDAARGTSVEEAYKKLTTAEMVPDVEASRQAAAIVTDEVNSPYATIDASMARDILEKRADILTPDQVSNLRTYVTTNEAMDTLSNTLDDARVRSDIIKGGNGNIGARTYVNAIISSIKLGDNKAATGLADDLTKFANRHAAKAIAMNHIIASFDAGTPMAAADQVKLMAPFNSKVKGNTFKPFTRSIPKYARMIGEEANMLNTVSTAMNERVSTLAAQPAAATQAPDTSVPNVSPEPTNPAGDASAAGRIDIAGELNTLLALPEDQAINKLQTKPNQTDAQGNRIDNADDATLAQPGEIDVPTDSKPVTQITAKDGGTVDIVEDTDGSMYAIRNGAVAGIIAPVGTNETSLQMVAGNEGQGIASKLTAEFIRKNPNQGAGSFTEGGEATYKAALKQLRAEQTKSSTTDANPEIKITSRETDGATPSVAAEVPRGVDLSEPVAVESNHLLQDLIKPELNLVAQHLKVRDLKLEGNPLVNDPNFIADLRKNGVSYEALKQYLPESVTSLNDAQVTLFNRFLAFNEAFKASIDEVIRETPIEFAYRDAINYLRDTAGNIKSSVIDAMSVSAFNWMIANANDSLVKTPENLGAMLDMGAKNHSFSNYTWSTLGKAGLPYEDTAKSLGREIVSTLGLGINSPDAPNTLMARLEFSLGGRALQTLAQITTDEAGTKPIVKLVNVTANQREIAKLIEKDFMSEVDAKAQVSNKTGARTYTESLRTVQVSYTEDNFGNRVPDTYVKNSVLEPAKEAGPFLNQVFSSLESDVLPSFEPSKTVGQNMLRTDRKVSEFAKGQLREFGKTKNYLKTPLVKVFQHFSAEEMADMFGFETDLENKVHKDTLESAKSKNNLIRRNVDKVNDFLKAYSDKELDTPFYLDMETTRVNRAQVKQSIMNMQSDKTARHMAYQEGWNTQLDMNNDSHINNFLLAVGQALGVSVDKNYNTEAIEATKAILNNPVIADGVLAGVALLNDQATADQMNDLREAVKASDIKNYKGKSAAALDGILAYAGYVDAFNKGQDTFTSNVAVEYDGVTNGPMLTLIQFANADSNWASDLKAGGIYINSSLQNVVDAKRQGNPDVYEKTTLIMGRILDGVTSMPASKKKDALQFKIDGEFKSALNNIFGVLTAIDPETGIPKVTGDGRTIAKSVVTPKNYQASDAKTQTALGQEALAAIRNSLAEWNTLANGDISADERMKIVSDAKALSAALDVLAPNLITVPVVDGKKDYLNAKIGESIVYRYESTTGLPIKMKFTDMLAATYGAMFTNAVNMVNKPMEDTTKDTVVVTNMAVMVFEAARIKLISDAMAAKAANGRAGLGNELTVGELKSIESNLQAMFPEVMTALSDKQGEGVSLLNIEAGAGTPFTVEMKLGDKALGASTVDGTHVPAPAASYFEVDAAKIQSPGVTGVVNNVLATDGAIALKGSAKSSSQLSLYDAFMSNPQDAVNDSKQWNRAMFDVALNHSIPVNVSAMATRVLDGANKLLGNITFTEEQLRKYSLYDYIEGGLTTNDIGNFVSRYQEQANKLQEAKRNLLMNNTVTVNHYYSEGAAVTYVNGKEVSQTESAEQLTTDFNNAIRDTVEVAKQTPKNGDITVVDAAHAGVPTSPIKVQATADNDLAIAPELTEAFDYADGVLSLREAVDTLTALENNSATVNAVGAIARALINGSDPKTVVVRYDANIKYTGELAWLNSNADVIQYANTSRGMYFNKQTTGTVPVILLMSETMPYSGVIKETLFHELVHSLFDTKIYNSLQSPVGIELQNLIRTVKAQVQTIVNSDTEASNFINSYGGINKLPALTSVREFVAWGLSSAQFQKILAQVAYASSAELDNKLQIKPTSALAKLRDLVQRVIFSRDTSAPINIGVDNALNALITVALKTQQGSIDPEVAASVSRQQGPASQLLNISKMNSKTLFSTLKDVGFVKATLGHQVFLENMLNTVVNAVLNPLRVSTTLTDTVETVSDLSAHDKLDIFIADNSGLSMSNLPAQYGFNKSAQEVYVHGLYLAILEEGLKVGSAHLNAANDFFNKAKAGLTYKNFMANPASIDPTEIANAQSRYDSVFDITASKQRTITDPSSGLSKIQQKSDYLRNFLALAATNEQFRNALDSIQSPVTTKPESLFDRIIQLISNLIDLVSDRVTGVQSTLSNTGNIDKLTARLVGAELTAKSDAERVLNATVEYSSAAVTKALRVFKQGLIAIGNVPALKNSPVQAVRLLTTIVRVVGNSKTQYMFDELGDLFNRLNVGKQGFIGELGNEIKGTTKDTAKVHALLRVANFTLDRGRKAVIDTMSNALDKQFKGVLTKIERTAITKQVLRTDLAALINHGYDLNQMADLMEDAGYLNQEVNKFEDQIRNAVPTRIANFYLNQAEDLGFTMVNGFSSNAGHIPNAYGITRLWGTSETVPNDSTLALVEPMIDALATLRAVERVTKKGTYDAAAVNVIRREAGRTDGDNSVDNNGMVFVLTQHQLLKEKALKDNFNGNPALMRKGYMPDINNPYIDVQPALVSAKDEMKARGYKEMYELEKDAYDSGAGTMALYIGDGAGLTGYMRGAFSTTSQKTKGTRVNDYGTAAVMHAQKFTAINQLFDSRISPVYGRNEAFMQPLYNEDGAIVDYRYVMAEATKDDLLSRNENYSEVLGKLAGITYDKTVTKPHNQTVMEALKEQYDLDVANGKADSYIRVGARSDDPELKDLYNLLPHATRQYAKQVFGSDSIPIRAEFLRIIFGYRKLSIGDLWQEGGIDNNLFQTSVKTMFDSLFGTGGLRAASVFERAVQDLVRVGKSNIIVRMGSVTLSNLVSNTYELLIHNVNLKDAIADQVTGFKKGVEYVKHGSRISELDLLLQADHNPTQRKQMEAERTQLKHLQAINPVSELIEAGLLQTIALDVNQDIDPFSHSSILANKVNAQLDKLPTNAKDATKFLFMTRDSASFEFMNRMVQFSDFAARYALYKQLTTRVKDPLDKGSAIQAVIDQFINYDLPTHKAIQYGNDMGLIWFSRYWIRIQKVLRKNFAANPAGILIGLGLQEVTGVDVADTNDSSIFRTGLFHPIRGLSGIGSGLLANPVIPTL